MGQSRLGINAEVQVYNHRSIRVRKPLKRRRREGDGDERRGGNKLQSFISIITIKNCHSGWYWFLIYKRKQREED